MQWQHAEFRLAMATALGLAMTVAMGCGPKPAGNSPAPGTNSERPMGHAQAGDAPASGSELFALEVPVKISDLEAKITEAAKAHKFGVPGTRNLAALLKEKGQNPTNEYWVYDVCNPVLAATLLAEEPRAVAIMPCRVCAFAEPDAEKTTVVFVKPTHLAHPYENEKVKQIAAEVEQALIAIVKQVAGE